MAHRRIGQVLVDMGFITDEQQELLVDEQHEHLGQLLGKVAIDMGLIGEDQLVQALAEQLSLQTTAANEITIKKDVHTRAAEEQLRVSLGTPVAIKRKGKGGTIAITFTSENELQRLYEYLTEKR